MLYFKMNKNLFQPTIINVNCPLKCSVPQNSMFGLPRLVEGKLMAVKNFQENMSISHVRGYLTFIRVSLKKFP
jgi:hypothetical protein